MWIPGVMGGLRHNVGEVGCVEEVDEPGDVFGGGAASVKEEHDAAGFAKRGAEAEGGSVVVKVHCGEVASSE